METNLHNHGFYSSFYVNKNLMTSYMHHRKNVDQMRQGTARRCMSTGEPEAAPARRQPAAQHPVQARWLGVAFARSPYTRTYLSSDSDVPTANAPNESEQDFRQVVSGRSLGQTTAQLSKNCLMWRPIEWFGPCGLARRPELFFISCFV
jgi:hypothetical protein